jgi:hypothetical protein
MRSGVYNKTPLVFAPRLRGDYQAEANDANYSSDTKHEATLVETPWAGIVKMRHHEFYGQESGVSAVAAAYDRLRNPRAGCCD